MPNPVYNAINKPLNLFGINRSMFTSIGFLCITVFWFSYSFIFALVLFVVLFASAQAVTRKDDKFLKIWMALRKMSHLYDSAERE